MNNIAVIVNDCLRYDRVTPQYMPFLASYAQKNTAFTNYWSTSHCTDPAMCSLLGGVWPDEIGLYSMLFEQPDYTIPDSVIMLPQLAREHGYKTGFSTNLGRWYSRGVDDFMAIDQYDNQRGAAFSLGHEFLLRTPATQPWFLVIHDASCHANYRGGSYDAACAAVDYNLSCLLPLLENAYVIITADHGEDLYQHGIEGHGFGMWPTITHVPLIIHSPGIENPLKIMPGVQQHIELHDFIARIVRGEAAYFVSHEYAHIVGRTPTVWNRAVTDGYHMLVKSQVPGNITWSYFSLSSENEKYIDFSFERAMAIARLLKESRLHAQKFGVDADTGMGHNDDGIIIERLRNLGYFG